MSMQVVVARMPDLWCASATWGTQIFSAPGPWIVNKQTHLAPLVPIQENKCDRCFYTRVNARSIYGVLLPAGQAFVDNMYTVSGCFIQMRFLNKHSRHTASQKRDNTRQD